MSTPGKRVLVVDDEAHITHVVALKLRNAGFEVRTAADGEEALDLSREWLPDLVITDLQMPYLSGMELCARLKESPRTASVPAIMLTARGHALADNDLARTNIRLVLSKPFSPRQILQEVNAVLGIGENAPVDPADKSVRWRADAA